MIVVRKEIVPNPMNAYVLLERPDRSNPFNNMCSWIDENVGIEIADVRNHGCVLRKLLANQCLLPVRLLPGFAITIGQLVFENDQAEIVTVAVFLQPLRA